MVKKIHHHAHLSCGGVLGIHGLPECVGIRQTAGVPGDVLAGNPAAGVFTIKPIQFSQVAVDDLGHFGQIRVREVLASLQKIRNLPEDPRLALRRPANHQRIGTGPGQHLGGLFGAVDVAVGNDRDAGLLLHRRNQLIAGRASVHLLTGAAMDGQRGHPGLFSNPGNAQDVFLAIGVAQPGFQGHRHVHRSDHGVEQALDQRLILQQGRTGQTVADFFDWAAHVDVHDLGTVGHLKPRRLGQFDRVGPGDLCRDGGDFPVKIGTKQAFLPGIQGLVGGHHFADRMACAQPLAQGAKWPVGDARHGGHHQAIGQGVRTDVHGVLGSGFRGASGPVGGQQLQQGAFAQGFCQQFIQAGQSLQPVPADLVRQLSQQANPLRRPQTEQKPLQRGSGTLILLPALTQRHRPIKLPRRLLAKSQTDLPPELLGLRVLQGGLIGQHDPARIQHPGLQAKAQRGYRSCWFRFFSRFSGRRSKRLQGRFGG